MLHLILAIFSWSLRLKTLPWYVSPIISDLSAHFIISQFRRCTSWQVPTLCYGLTGFSITCLPTVGPYLQLMHASFASPLRNMCGVLQWYWWPSQFLVDIYSSKRWWCPFYPSSLQATTRICLYTFIAILTEFGFSRCSTHSVHELKFSNFNFFTKGPWFAPLECL
jgi:hypothetical protein